ncbi:MAG: TolC family protein [Pseudomonadota bacterium]|nr:TolC family protein [Pseudomonadota bacterium]
MLALGLMLAGPSVSAQSLNLEQALRAGAQRPSAQVAALEAAADEASAQAVQREAWWPSLQLQADQSWHSDQAMVDTPAGALTTSDSRQLLASLSLRQPLLDLASSRYRKPAAQAGARSARALAAREAERTAFLAARIWLQAARLEVRIAAARSHERSLEAQSRRLSALFDSGRALRADVLSVQLARDAVRRDLVRLQQSRAAAGIALAQAVGRAPPVSPAGYQRLGDDLQLPPADPDTVAERREDLRALRQRIAGLGLEAEAVRAEQRLPTVDLVAEHRQSDGLSLYPEHDELIALQLKWTLFDAGTTRLRHREQLLRRDALRARLQDLQNGIAAELARARADFEAAQAAARYADLAVASARETLDTRNALFDAGRANVDEVLGAEALLADNDALRTTARLDAVEACLAWQLAAGLPLSPSAAVASDSTQQGGQP